MHVSPTQRHHAYRLDELDERDGDGDEALACLAIIRRKLEEVLPDATPCTSA